MAIIEKLQSLNIDVEKGIYKVNGRDISKSGKYLKLTFENGVWSLMITEDNIFSTNDHASTLYEKGTAIATDEERKVKIMDTKRIPLHEAAKILGLSPQGVREHIKRNLFHPPIGRVTNPTGRKNQYHIFKDMLDAYMGIVKVDSEEKRLTNE